MTKAMVYRSQEPMAYRSTQIAASALIASAHRKVVCPGAPNVGLFLLKLIFLLFILLT